MSNTLDFQEFIARQEAFVQERKQHMEAQRAARPVKPAWMSPGSERILKQSQVSLGALPLLRPVDTIRDDQ
jgi:hypothetical protein